MVRAIVGACWGDEGKGKITDMLAENSDIIVRFQGGSNAGHTIINDYGKFALHLLPSGVFYNHTTSIIGNGVALNIPYLVKEVNELVSKGVPRPKILVSNRAQILMPYHILFDEYEEERLGKKSFGSTKSGIAPFYSDKYAKIGFQVSELFDDAVLEEKVNRVCEQKNVILEHMYHKPTIDPKELLATLREYRDMVEPFVCDTVTFLHNAIKEGKNIFAGNLYGGLSQEALWYIGGIIKHAKSLNAFTNPSTNSYKRLVPGFEAPLMLAYSAANRSASIRIPYAINPKTAHIEVRFPDCMANPYLAFAAMLMAGLDGIKNKIEPGEAMDKNLYDLPPEEAANVPQVCGSLDEALKALRADHDYLTEGGVFSEDMINAYIELKAAEDTRVRSTPHPAEFELYYSL